VFEVPPQPRNSLGVVMKMGPITAIQKGSPAAIAGLKTGDVIEAVDQKRNGAGAAESESWNAETLPDYLARAARERREVEISVLRPSAEGGQPQRVDVRLTPQVPIQVHSPFPARNPGAPAGSDEIGIAYSILNELEAVEPNGPASTSGLSPGDTVLEAKIVFPKDKNGKAHRPITLDLGPRKLYWPTLTDAVQFVPEGTRVELAIARGANPDEEAEPRKITLAPAPTMNGFIAARGFWFQPLERTRKAQTLAEQIRYGWDETAESLTMVYRFLQKLGTQVPITALGGPVTIAKAAGYSAAEGLPTLLVFLTMLSANLAVINFLPIPLLDGGHMVFLAYEWIRGRPANERFVVALHTVGFVFIVSLMLYVLALDFNLIERKL
jgi:regulator of sigma E protease